MIHERASIRLFQMLFLRVDYYYKLSVYDIKRTELASARTVNTRSFYTIFLFHFFSLCRNEPAARDHVFSSKIIYKLLRIF